MFNKIYEILTEFLGESKQGYYSTDVYQYQFNCPYCREENDGIPDGKYNLEVNFQIQRFHCWKCGDTNGMKGKISFLIKRFGNKSLYKSYIDEIEAIKRTRLYDFEVFSGLTIDTEVETYIRLPKTFKKIDLAHSRKNVREYCEKRGIDQHIIDRFNIGATSWDGEESSWRNRIIIPSYNTFGDLNYFVGRDFSGKSKMKYKNCDADKKTIVYQESKIDTDSDIILVEGAIDCIYGPNTISMLGKSLTKDSELYNFLYKKANGRIIICLDNDTDIVETKKIYNLLNFGRLKGKIYYIRLNVYKDFGELYEKFGKRGIIQAIKGAKQFSELDLVYE